jgi:hypothetical protein
MYSVEIEFECVPRPCILSPQFLADDLCRDDRISKYSCTCRGDEDEYEAASLPSLSELADTVVVWSARARTTGRARCRIPRHQCSLESCNTLLSLLCVLLIAAHRRRSAGDEGEAGRGTGVNDQEAALGRAVDVGGPLLLRFVVVVCLLSQHATICSWQANDAKAARRGGQAAREIRQVRRFFAH